MKKLLFCTLLASLLAGCGVKGPLYFPAAEQAPNTQQQAQS